MGNDEGRAIGAKTVDRGLDASLGFDVQRRSRLVQNEDWRILQDCAGQRDTLALAARQPVAAIAHDRIVTGDTAFDEVIGRRSTCSFDHVVRRRILAADADVVRDRAVQQTGILEHRGNGAAQRLPRHLGDVHPVDEDFALLRVINALQQVDQRRLACPRRADNGNRLARLNRKGHIADTLRRIGEVEGDVAELDLTGHLPEVFCLD